MYDLSVMAYRIPVDLGRILELICICVYVSVFITSIYFLLNQWIFSKDQPLFATKKNNKNTNFFNRELTRCGHLFCLLFVRDENDVHL